MIQDKAKILLVNPSSREHYRQTKIRAGAIYPPPLNLALLAASLMARGHEVRIADFNLSNLDDRAFKIMLLEFAPGYVGITFATPLFKEVQRLSRIVKEGNSHIKIIGGGAHASSLPEETLKDSQLDIVVMGEGDFILPEIVNSPLTSFPGVIYKGQEHLHGQLTTIHIQDLDSLLLPAWSLYDLRAYRLTSLLASKNPAGFLETSRGCPCGCAYCNKSVFGRKYRFKSVKRVVEEMAYMVGSGFREIFIADDNFSADLQRAKGICREMIRQRVKIVWTPLTGLRIDRVDRELLELMHRAGCYRVYYGVESGSQAILDKIGKGITLAQVKEAVKETKRVGMEVFAFFMLGLPGETKETIKETINFSQKAGFDWAKLSITTPLPDTPLFDEYEKRGLIKSRDWSKYNLYDIQRISEVYTHPNLDWYTIKKFYRLFYRSFYLRPAFIIKRLLKGILKGNLWEDIRHAVKTPW